MNCVSTCQYTQTRVLKECSFHFTKITAQCTMRLVLIILEKYFLVMVRHLLV